jgi:mannosylglucosylglycerate synthase
MPVSNLRVGIVSTRLESTDGVSLEAQKWARVLARLGHRCFYFAGLCDQDPNLSYVVPEAHFAHPTTARVLAAAFQSSSRPRSLTDEIRNLSEYLKDHLYQFVKRFDLDLLLIENALSIPLNIPLGLALTELLIETGIPAIAHHHDLYWERRRFLVNCVWDYLDMCFPPRLPHVRHVVINSPAAAQLSYRRGISAHLIPNVMDFDSPAPKPDDYASTVRPDLGIKPDEYFFLQPTRVVWRKGIEHSIELVRRLRLPARLVISHETGDEGDAYEQHLRTFSDLLAVPTSFNSDIISDRRGTTADGRKIYALWDVYPFADMITFPSLIEGFGNAFLESVYFRKPIVVNDYTIYAIDIKPKGFRAIELDGFVTDEAVARVEKVLETPSIAVEMTNHNYELARRFYSFAFLEQQLRGLLQSFTGEDTVR